MTKTSDISIGLLLPRYFKYYAYEVVEGMLDVASQNRKVHFRDLRFLSIEQARKNLNESDVDAMVFGLNTTEFEALADALPTDIPMVNLHPDIVDASTPTVCLDMEAHCRVAADYFEGLGYDRLGFFGDSCSSAVKESTTMLKAIAEARGLTFSSNTTKLSRSVYTGTDALPSSKSVEQWLKQMEKPVAILTSGGYSARFLERSARRIGYQTPADIAILSQSDDEICMFADPPISAIRLSGQTCGRIALETILGMIAGKRPPSGRLTVPAGNVIERRSTDFHAGIPDTIRVALRYIRDRACKGIGVADVLREVRIISRTALYEQFTHFIGRSPAEEIMRIRIGEAKRLLVSTRLAAGNIGEMCGFSSQSQFTRTFRRETGLTPCYFRKRNASSACETPILNVK